MTLCFFIAIALSVLTDAAVSVPAFATVTVARDSQRAERVRPATVRFSRNGRARRPAFAAISVRRILAPLTGAASPRAPARAC